jgi:hypothetical protein
MVPGSADSVKTASACPVSFLWRQSGLGGCFMKMAIGLALLGGLLNLVSSIFLPTPLIAKGLFAGIFGMWLVGKVLAKVKP